MLFSYATALVMVMTALILLLFRPFALLNLKISLYLSLLASFLPSLPFSTTKELVARGTSEDRVAT